MVEVKQHTKRINGKNVLVKSYTRKEPILSAKDFLKKEDTHKGYKINIVKDKNYGLYFVTDISNKELNNSIEPKGEDFKTKNEALDYAKKLIDKNIKIKEYKSQYMLLDRLKSDCDYYLNYPNTKHLYHKNVDEQISEMKKLYNSLPEKPEWLSLKDIENYEKNMKNKSNEYVRKTLSKEQFKDLCSKGGTSLIKPNEIKIPKEDIKKIYQVSNPNTLPKNFSQKRPVSYGFYKLQNNISGDRGDYGEHKLKYVNDDKDNVYVQYIKPNEKGNIVSLKKKDLAQYPNNPESRSNINRELQDSF